MFGNICKEFILHQDAPSTRERDLEEEWEQIKSAAELLHLIRIVYVSQSGLESMGIGSTRDAVVTNITGGTSSQNIMFSDDDDPHFYKIDSSIEGTRYLQDSNDASLAHFLSRPIKVAELPWATSTTLSHDFDPWALFFNDPRVRARISNFHLLRCRLHVKILLNGSPFQYGRLMASYQPLFNHDGFSTNAALVREDLVQASQMPHLYLDPCTSQGGEMLLPFYWHRNYLNIPTKHYEQVGKMYLRTLNPLKHANGADDLVTISIFVWAENVHLSVLTSLAPQSGKEIDEVNRKGYVSGPATAVAKVAMALKDAPVIGPYAHATAMAANTTATIAKALGYCRPPVTKDADPVKPHTISSLSLTNVGDGVSKMTVDDKQELSTDPRITGLGSSDQMVIKDIAKRESYLTTFDWSIGVPTETLLYNFRVDPATWAESGITGGTYHFPACAMAAMPFKYWTGSLRYRFQFVCSSFHRGRVKIVYDPSYLTSTDYNVNYMHIVDISNNADFTVEVANTQHYTLLSRATPGVNSVTEMYSDSIYTTLAGFGNGVLGIYVVNELTTPNSTVNNDIQVNVFISAGDDFEVFVPDNHFQFFTFASQSGLETHDSDESAPVHDTATTLGLPIRNTAMINKVYTGEAILSFRTMLKRYNLWNSLGLLDSSPHNITGRFNAFPYYRGYMPSGVENTAGGVPYNYCNTVLMHWVTLAFQGWRGSIRYKIVPRGPLSADHRPTIYVTQAPGTDTPYNYVMGTPDSATTQKDASLNIIPTQGALPAPGKPFTGTRGSVYANGYLNVPVEFEVPFYSTARFSPGKFKDLTTASQYTQHWDYNLTAEGTSQTFFDIHVAAGEDFQTYFFTGLPRAYYEPYPPL